MSDDAPLSDGFYRIVYAGRQGVGSCRAHFYTTGRPYERWDLIVMQPGHKHAAYLGFDGRPRELIVFGKLPKCP